MSKNKNKKNDPVLKQMQVRLSKKDHPYDVFSEGLGDYYIEYLEDNLNLDFTAFLQSFNLTPYLLKYEGIDFVEDTISRFTEFLAFYHLLQTKSKNDLQAMVQKLPATDQQKEIILTWPKQYICSLFVASFDGNTLVVKDLQSNMNYPMPNAPKNFIQLIREIDSDQFIGIFVPTEDEYIMAAAFPTMIAIDNFSEISSPPLSTKKVEKRLLNWYRETLSEFFEQLEQLHEMISDNFDEFDFLDEPEYDYYPMERLPKESNQAYSSRLIDQDPTIKSFPQPRKLKQLLLKVIETFPQLFIAEGNAYGPINGVKYVFTDGIDDRSTHDYLEDELGYYWYQLILEYLPEEVEKAKPFRLIMDNLF